MEATERTRLKRSPKRGEFSDEQIYAILDEAFVCHIGGVVDGYPVVQPNLHWRIGNTLYIHGSSKNGLISAILEQGQTCITVSLFDGLVLARSAFHHSINYRSVMLFGKPEKVEDEKTKAHVLDALIEKCQVGRSKQVRPANPTELKATTVIAINIEEASAKMRSGAPIDDEDDMDWPVWAGIIPASITFGEPDEDTTGR